MTKLYHVSPSRTIRGHMRGSGLVSGESLAGPEAG